MSDEQIPLPIYPLTTPVWPNGEVKGGLTHSQHIMPERRCSCYHWPGWKGETKIGSGWAMHERRLHLTKTEIVELWRVAARHYKASGRPEQAKQCFRTARQIERTSRSRSKVHGFRF